MNCVDGAKFKLQISQMDTRIRSASIAISLRLTDPFGPLIYYRISILLRRMRAHSLAETCTEWHHPIEIESHIQPMQIIAGYIFGGQIAHTRDTLPQYSPIDHFASRAPFFAFGIWMWFRLCTVHTRWGHSSEGNREIKKAIWIARTRSNA